MSGVEQWMEVGVGYPPYTVGPSWAPPISVSGF